MILDETIIALRSPELTSFFKIFPLFVSDTFYITVIALGYWLAKKSYVFWQLGFLTPSSCLITSILKNIFNCARPDASLHLINVIDRSTGFPSGDVLVSTVFWGMIFLNFKSKLLRVLGATIILCVMVSRIYLGVHTTVQVFGGLFFGIVIVKIVMSSFGRKMFNLWKNGEVVTYWIFCIITSFTNIITSKITMPLTYGLVGILIGYGLSLRFANEYMASTKRRTKFLIVLPGIFSLWLINYLFPKIHFEQVTLVDAIFLAKYCIIGLVIFTIVPLILKSPTESH